MARRRIKKQTNWPMIFGAITLTVAGISAAVIGLYRYISNFDPKMTTETFIVEVDEGKAPSKDELVSVNKLKVTDVFSESNVERYDSGDGILVIFVRQSKGIEQERVEFELKKFNEFKVEGANFSERRDQVQAKKLEFDTVLDNFLNNKHATRNIEFHIDITGGMNAGKRTWVNKIIQEQTSVLFKSGDAAEVLFNPVADVDYDRTQTVAIEEKNSTSEKQAQVNKKLEETVAKIFKDSPETKESSIATGIFNALKKNAGKKYRTVNILSDFMENSQNTVSFYKNPELLKEENWDQLDQKMTAQEQLPRLENVTVHLYAPPAGGQNAKTIRAAMKYFAHLLKKAGASSVETHF